MKKSTKRKLIISILIAPIITGVILGYLFNSWIAFFIPIVLMFLCWFFGMFLANVFAYVEKREPND
jgi:hypothetical protein